MVGCGFLIDFFDLKCSSYGCQLYFFIFGMVLAYDTVFFSHVQATSGSNTSLEYGNCGIHPDGVHDLECFQKYESNNMACVWKPGKHTLQKIYVLFIEQKDKNYCRKYFNLSVTSKNFKFHRNHYMTAVVFENSEANCTKAVFGGSPKNLVKCGPPSTVSFSRHSGQLDVNVTWQKTVKKAIRYYSVRYKAVGSLLWSKSPVRSQDVEHCTVKSLNTSLAYTVQIQCVNNSECSQCVWSDVYTVPSELTTQPVIVSFKDSDIAEGRRLLSLVWRFSAKEFYDGYYVTIWKASGEATRERINTTKAEIKLILSYSAYHVNISAVNNVSTSPAVSHIIPQQESRAGMGARKLNVIAHNNRSFTIYWEDSLIKKYVCYCVEWIRKRHKVMYMPFHEDRNDYRTLSPIPESLEPYQRYSLTLYTRPNKDTCNMRYINNSESTYGSTQFYFIEGSPVSSTDIISYNVTLNSVVLEWTSIPEEDVRGFLLGYVIYYAECYHNGDTSPERNITVDPLSNSYELTDLQSGTAYQVQISGFTQAGTGVRSTPNLFKTESEGYFNLSGITTVLAVVATVLIFGSLLMKRAKVILWPSIPNPGESNAMQIIEGPCELELLESITTLKVVEWDTNSVQIVEKEDVIPVSTIPSMQPLLHASEDEGDSPEMTCNCFQRNAEDAASNILPDVTTETFSSIQHTDIQTSATAFCSGYTTMEMFQQGTPQGVPVNTSVTRNSEPETSDMKSGLDYVRQFSNSPITESEELSIIL